MRRQSDWPRLYQTMRRLNPLDSLGSAQFQWNQKQTRRCYTDHETDSFFFQFRIHTFDDPFVVSVTKETGFDSCLIQNVDLPFTKVVLMKITMTQREL